MPSLLLDTHVWLWWLLGQPELSTAERDALDAYATAGTPPAISAISLWEAQMLASKERLQLDTPLTHWLPSAAAPEIVTVLPLDTDVILALDACSRSATGYTRRKHPSVQNRKALETLRNTP
jgi:PIN domain nuclease of toxin-antitoxin system